MTTKHTPGPWVRDTGSGFGCDVRAQNGRKVAAAPELLEALQKRAQADAAYAQLALSDVDPDTHERLLQQIEAAEDAAKDAARAAIAKAKGEQQ
ncbi:MAG: hypothetical protein ACN6PJ_28525 [Achromobacter sp.]|uniref:hypothetical protein n=1 Tax=Achromobacter sp. TaxID=134375 RepID=UPI003CFFDF37